jgi:hypothetical protein
MTKSPKSQRMSNVFGPDINAFVSDALRKGLLEPISHDIGTQSSLNCGFEGVSEDGREWTLRYLDRDIAFPYSSL